MPVLYFHPSDEELPVSSAGLQVDGEDSWWAGVQQCAATIALAACLTVTALSTAQAAAVGNQHQDDPAGTLSGQPDEDYWQNQTPPVPASLYVKLPLGDPEELPAGKLFGQYDEDFWVSGVAPVPASLYVKLPLGDPEELPAGALYGQPDEDFWVSGVAPVPANLYVKLPLGDPEELPAGALYGQPDEDYWWPATMLGGPWQALAAQVRPFAADDEIFPVSAAFQPDEDYCPLQVWQPIAWQARLFTDDDVIESLPFDEDYWQNQAPPVAASLYVKLPLGDPEELPAGVLHGPEEDYWPLQVWQAVAAQVRPFADDDAIFPAVAAFQPDEDYWWPAPWPPAALAAQIRVFADDDVFFPVTFQGSPDEDYWQNRVAPVAASLYVKLPVGDPEELPAGSLLYGPLDEDFWGLAPWKCIAAQNVLAFAQPVADDDIYFTVPPAVPGPIFYVPFN